MTLARIANTLRADLKDLAFGAPITHVYNPLEYAWPAYKRYVEMYGAGTREAVFVGMNPGPWGMAQSGVPFGHVGLVRDWLGVEAKVATPPHMHPARPVKGFACTRAEASGARFWGWASERFGTPQRFFGRFFVLNYCPLLFLASTGPRTATNITPDKLRKEERAELFAACDRHLRAAVELLRPQFLIGVGAFAEGRIRETLGEGPWRIGQILHPSPASPAANRGWAPQAEAQLRKLGLKIP